MRVNNPPVFSHLVAQGGQLVKVMTFNIGVWNMDTDNNVTVNTPIDISAFIILGVHVIILQDTPSTNRFVFGRIFNQGTGTVDGAANLLTGTTILLQRTINGGFDGAGFDDAVMNRGYITIFYI